MKTYQHARSTEWMLRAKCRDAPAEMFFAPPSAVVKNSRTIREFCATCPVRTACLAFALADPAKGQYGLWGGMSATRRQALLHEATTPA